MGGCVFGLTTRDGIDAWWEDHRAMRYDLMRLITREWQFGATQVVLTARVMDYLEEHADWLPCDPGAFYSLYFARFWPRF